MRFSGRRILVVGASGGLGLALAAALDRRGSRLVLFSRHLDRIKTGEEGGLAGRHQLVAGDLRQPADLEKLDAAIVDHGGELDGIIFAAGVSRPDLIESLDLERALDTLQVNLEAPFRVFYRYLPRLLQRPGSFLAGITSMAGDRGMPRGHAYSASKAGFDRLLESLRIDLLDRDLRVFTIVPGYVETLMSSQNRFPMLGMWPAQKAADHILHAMEKNRLVIRFPWYHSLGMRLLCLLPDRLYWWLMNRQRSQVKIMPHPDEHFTWDHES